MQPNRTSFPPVFWVANLIEVLERFVYYGIYFGFGIYLTRELQCSAEALGTIQMIFLLASYVTPLFSGALADRYGFKRLLIVSYCLYIPSVLLLLLTKSCGVIPLTMLAIGFAAGVFKPLISGTVRAVTDKTNTSLGFGIFYAMVNVGGSVGPIVAGKLRAISWDLAFTVAGVVAIATLLITILFYKEPEREPQTATIGEKLGEIVEVLTDLKFAAFLLLLGLFFWIPFWAFFNLCALYVDASLDTAELYGQIRSFFSAFLPDAWGTAVANFFSQEEDGVRRVLGETIAHTGWIIMVVQVPVSWVFERFRPIPSFLFGLLVAGVGFVVIGFAAVDGAAMVFLGILLFAVGEMISSPRIQEYITWLAPKEKAGLYMGSNFLAVAVGAASGPIYTPMWQSFGEAGHPERVWYVLAAHMIVGIFVFVAFQKLAGEFKLQEE